MTIRSKSQWRRLEKLVEQGSVKQKDFDKYKKQSSDYDNLPERVKPKPKLLKVKKGI